MATTITFERVSVCSIPKPHVARSHYGLAARNRRPQSEVEAARQTLHAANILAVVNKNTDLNPEHARYLMSRLAEAAQLAPPLNNHQAATLRPMLADGA